MIHATSTPLLLTTTQGQLDDPLASGAPDGNDAADTVMAVTSDAAVQILSADTPWTGEPPCFSEEDERAVISDSDSKFPGTEKAFLAGLRRGISRAIEPPSVVAQPVLDHDKTSDRLRFDSNRDRGR